MAVVFDPDPRPRGEAAWIERLKFGLGPRGEGDGIQTRRFPREMRFGLDHPFCWLRSGGGCERVSTVRRLSIALAMLLVSVLAWAPGPAQAAVDCQSVGAVSYASRVDIRVSIPDHYPQVTTTFSAKLSTTSSVARVLLAAEPEDEQFQTALDCLIGEPISADPEAFRLTVPANGMTLMVALDSSSEITDSAYPLPVGAWLITTSDGRIKAEANQDVFAAPGPVELEARSSGLRRVAVSPVPRMTTTDFVAWRFADTAAAAQARVTFHPSVRTQILIGEARRLRWLRQASWWATTMIVPLLLFVALVSVRFRRRLGAMEWTALKVSALLLALAATLFYASPGFGYRASPFLMLLISAAIFRLLSRWVVGGRG